MSLPEKLLGPAAEGAGEALGAQVRRGLRVLRNPATNEREASIPAPKTVPSLGDDYLEQQRLLTDYADKVDVASQGVILSEQRQDARALELQKEANRLLQSKASWFGIGLVLGLLSAGVFFVVKNK